ncbi:MAG: glycosyltransferase [Candidatus Micrarchaeaceae archaeon]
MNNDVAVTILPYRSIGSGMTTYSDYLIKAIFKAGANVRVVGFGPYPDFLKELDIPFYGLGKDPKKMDYLGGPAITYTWIKRRLNKFISDSTLKVGVFHFIYPGANFMSSKEAVRTVVTAWGYSSKLEILCKSQLDFPLFKYPVVVLGKLEHYYMDLNSYRKADLVIGTTSETVKFWSQRIKQFRGRYIPLPVEVNSTYNKLSSESRDDVSFLIAERDLERPRNNVWRVLEAFRSLHNKGFRNFSLHLVGGYGLKLKNVVEKLKSSGIRISLDQYLPKREFLDLLTKSDVSVVTRYIMDQGAYWPLEAMASGSCVIASDLPAFRDFVIPGMNGLLVDPFSVTDIVSKVQTILEDYKILVSLKEGAVSYIARTHSLDTVGKQLVNIYNEVLD